MRIGAEERAAMRMQLDTDEQMGTLSRANPHYGSMSLRDWFAGQAMAAIISKVRVSGLDDKKPDHDIMWASVAMGAYEYADAMLAQREKPSTVKE